MGTVLSRKSTCHLSVPSFSRMTTINDNQFTSLFPFKRFSLHFAVPFLLSSFLISGVATKSALNVLFGDAKQFQCDAYRT